MRWWHRKSKVEARLTLITACGARCRTCPSWTFPVRHMAVEDFRAVWRVLNEAPQIGRILLNNTGDLYAHPQHAEILEIVGGARRKPVFMVTNGALVDRIPRIDGLIFSFNGGNRRSYEYTTGLSYHRVVENIRAHYEQIKKVPMRQIHCLVWEGNKGCEADFASLWHDFPGQRRVSYKVDNQMGEDYTLAPHRRSESVTRKNASMFSGSTGC